MKFATLIYHLVTNAFGSPLHPIVEVCELADNSNNSSWITQTCLSLSLSLALSHFLSLDLVVVDWPEAVW